MKAKVFLVEWDSQLAQSRAATLARRGFQVETESENGGRAYRSIRTHMPDVVVIDLRRRPTHGRELARAIRDLRALRHLPILCVEEGVEARELTRSVVAEVEFVLDSELEHAIVETIAARQSSAAV